MRKSLTLLVAACGLFSACGSPPGPDGPQTVANPEWGVWQNAEEVPFRFVLEQTFGAEDEPPEEVLAVVSAVTTDAVGNLYVLDSRSSRIVSFAPDGAFLWTYGSRGEGPGEIRGPSGLFWDGADHLLFSNQRRTRLDRITLDGRYDGGWTADELEISDFEVAGVLLPTRIALHTYIDRKFGAEVHVVDLADPPLTATSYVIDQTGSMELQNAASARPDIGVVDGMLAAGTVDRYRIAYYDTTGREIAALTRNVAGMIRPGVFQMGPAVSVSMLSWIHVPFVVDNSFRIVQAHWPTNITDPDDYIRRVVGSRESIEVHRMRVTDLYDAENRLLYSWSALDPEPGAMPTIVHTDVQGRVYAMTDAPYPQLGRYRVEVSPPR